MGKNRIPGRKGVGGTLREVTEDFVGGVLVLAADGGPMTTRDVVESVWNDLSASDIDIVINRILHDSRDKMHLSPWTKVSRVDMVAPAVNGNGRRSVVGWMPRATKAAVKSGSENKTDDCDHEWRFNGGNPVCPKCNSYQGEFVQRVFPAARIPVTMAGAETIIAVHAPEANEYDIIGTDLCGDHLLRRNSDGAIGKFVRI